MSEKVKIVTGWGDHLNDMCIIPVSVSTRAKWGDLRKHGGSGTGARIGEDVAIDNDKSRADWKRGWLLS